MVQIEQGSRPLRVLLWVVVALALMVAVLWWLVAPRALADADEALGAPSVAVAPEEARSGDQDVPMDEATLEAGQRQAAAVLEKRPRVAIITGAVAQRPDFVSPLEWMMVKGAAQQHASPDHELTRLVNFLRFNKQLELWQSLEGSPDVARRAEAAEALLEDLPNRITAGEYRLAQAQQLLSALLPDVASEEAQRLARAEQEHARLRKAQASQVPAQAPEPAPGPA